MDPVTIAGIVLVAVLSITSHEAAHGFVAAWLGDPTARLQGRLTLNPIPHIDPVFTVLLPFVLLLSGSGIIFGGARPIPVDISRLHKPRRDWALVGAAGPAMNIFIAVALTSLLSAANYLGLVPQHSSLLEILTVGIFLNVLLAVFNLIPIPPLDGSRILQYFISDSALTAYRRIEQFGLLVILALLFFVPAFYHFIILSIFGVIEFISLPFGVWNIVQPSLQSLLFA